MPVPSVPSLPGANRVLVGAGFTGQRRGRFQAILHLAPAGPSAHCLLTAFMTSWERPLGGDDEPGPVVRGSLLYRFHAGGSGWLCAAV